MPQVTKQNPKTPTPTSKSSSNGSVLSEAFPVGNLDNDWIRMVIYGANRTGKTWLACQFPKPLLLVSFEPNPTGGAKTVKKVPGVIYLHLSSSESSLRLCKELQQGEGAIPKQLRDKYKIKEERFETYVVDGATSFQDIILQEVMGWDKLPEQLSFGSVGKQKYQERAEKTKEGLRPFADLPGHVLILAKEKDHNPPKDDYASVNKLTGGLQLESFFAEDVGGAVAGWLHDTCDYITRLYIEKEVITKEVKMKINGKEVVKKQEVETGKHVRKLRTMYHPNYAAGFRSENPDAIPEFITNPDYAKIAQVINGTYKVS